ncbi:hypothetical protein [Providencia phage PSTRCR_114]|uniref:HNH nuclease domain-containing protein n=1 Tax=Providencia phage PSTRCR_114 TaxID=2800824 RepID=A0A7T6ZMI4_9CAUD|nr:hypothetical protein [Providencia phage PSTRCR_114]
MSTIKELYENTYLTQAQIAERLGIHWKRVFKYVKANYSSEYRKNRKSETYRLSKLGSKNPMKGVFGSDHHNYKGEVSDNKGYMMMLKPEWYTGRKNSKYVFVHHVVVCEALGLTQIDAGMCVHHCDFNPLNNSFDNLVLLSMAEHAALHQALAGVTTISKESTLKWVEARRAGLQYQL